MYNLSALSEFLLIGLPDFILGKARKSHGNRALSVLHAAVDDAFSSGGVEDNDSGVVMDFLDVPLLHAAACHDVDAAGSLCVNFLQKLFACHNVALLAGGQDRRAAKLDGLL